MRFGLLICENRRNLWIEKKNLIRRLTQIAQIQIMRKDLMKEKQKDPRTYKIIGAGMEVHRELGAGFLEAVYQEALAIEFELQGIPFQREVDLPVQYKGHQLNTTYRADFICYDKAVIVEIKALSELSGREESQIINYLKATGIEVGLVLNFSSESLEYKRFVLQGGKNL